MPSAQQDFFYTFDLVHQVVGYLSRSDQINCLYVSTTFNTAAVPHVYKHARLEDLARIDHDLREKYLRTVVATDVKQWSDRDLSVAIPEGAATVIFDNQANNKNLTPYTVRYGSSPPMTLTRPPGWWVSVSSTGLHVVVHVGLDSDILSEPNLSNCIRAAIPPTAGASTPVDKTMTIVMVPPYISGNRPKPKMPSLNLMQAAQQFKDAKIEIVGKECEDPFASSDTEGLRSTTFNEDRSPRDPESFFAIFNTVWRILDHGSLDHIQSQLEYTTFKDYIETANTWRDVLDERKVGEWLNRYYEREAKEALAKKKKAEEARAKEKEDKESKGDVKESQRSSTDDTKTAALTVNRPSL